MKVILTQDVDALGLAGQVVTVADGYARNKLIPAQMAEKATPGTLKKFEKQRAEFEIRAMKEKELAQHLADRIKALHLTITQKAGGKRQTLRIGHLHGPGRRHGRTGCGHRSP